MKKNIFAFTLASLFFTGLAHADGQPLSLSIDGNVIDSSHPGSSCSVTLSKAAVTLTGATKSLPLWSDKVDTYDSAGAVQLVANDTCTSMIESGHIGYVFSGDYDMQTGPMTMKNTDVSSGAAKGVGIDVFVPSTHLPVLMGGTFKPTSNKTDLNLVLVKTISTPTGGHVSGNLTINVVTL
ncbi:hypothetical protein INF73_21905 [Enterobacter cloacae complex sp. P6RS]|uniref:hypothetical protein n=1 Tax=Enterobacter cloacae complex sp. P6RS TaxID=2779588 RepID=UPI0018744358|nr:hypothetical protein [Enterobacter cloacae complex sp. P6RS]MBE4994532.1 hypothetical protein [Enterobacter cloacae complex sp. P6RS]